MSLQWVPSHMKEKSALQKKLRTLGLTPRKTFGQHFLISPEIIQQMLEKIKKHFSDEIVEVGPGLGALTQFLRTLTQNLTVIELDLFLSQFWRRQGLNVIEKNVLHVDLKGEYPHAFLVGNLPFSIASRLLIKRSLESFPGNQMLFMFQKEVAERVLSSPRKKSYGLLSVLAQVFWEVEFLLEALPRDFYPSPQVSAHVLYFRRKRVHLNEPQLFLHFLKKAFLHRRKYLFKNIELFVSSDLMLKKEIFGKKKRSQDSVLDVDFFIPSLNSSLKSSFKTSLFSSCQQSFHKRKKIFDEMSLNREVRAEELSPETFLLLFQKLVETFSCEE